MTIWHLTSLFCGLILIAWLAREWFSRDRAGQEVQGGYGRWTRIKDADDDN